VHPNQRNKPAGHEFDLTKTNIITDVQYLSKRNHHQPTPTGGRRGYDPRPKKATADNHLAFDNQVHTIEFSRTRHSP